MATPPRGWLLNVLSPDSSGENTDDFRDNPASDTGEFYSDVGARGNYSTSRVPFAKPEGVVSYSGFGCTEADYERGYVVPSKADDPAYDKINYRDRWTQPQVPTEDQGNGQAMPNDWEFRQRNQRSRGFLTRPHLPTERS